jgi:hypothetical protein
MGVEEKLAPGVVAGVYGRFHGDNAELDHAQAVTIERGVLGFSSSDNHCSMSRVLRGLALGNWTPLSEFVEEMKTRGFKEGYPLYKGWTFASLVIGEMGAQLDGDDRCVGLCREAIRQELVMLAAQAAVSKPGSMILHINDSTVTTDDVKSQGEYFVQPLATRGVFGGGLGWHSECIATLMLQWMIHAEGRKATGRMKGTWYTDSPHWTDGIWCVPAIGLAAGPKKDPWKTFEGPWPGDYLDDIRELCRALIENDEWDEALHEASSQFKYRWGHEILRGKKKRVLNVGTDDNNSTKPPIMLTDWWDGVCRLVCPPKYRGQFHTEKSKAWIEWTEHHAQGITHNPVFDDDHNTGGDPQEYPDGYVYESKRFKRKKISLYLEKGDSKKKGLKEKELPEAA